MNSFGRWFDGLAAKVERLLFFLALLLMLLLAFSQAALRSAALRPYLNPVEILEGVPYRPPRGDERRP